MPHPQHKLIVNDSGINEYDIMRWIITCAYILLWHSKPTYYISFVIKYVDNWNGHQFTSFYNHKSNIIKDEALRTNCNVSHVTSVTLHQCLLLQTWQTYLLHNGDHFTTFYNHKSNIIKDEVLWTNCNVSHAQLCNNYFNTVVFKINNWL